MPTRSPLLLGSVVFEYLDALPFAVSVLVHPRSQGAPIALLMRDVDCRLWPNEAIAVGSLLRLAAIAVESAEDVPPEPPDLDDESDTYVTPARWLGTVPARLSDERAVFVDVLIGEDPGPVTLAIADSRADMTGGRASSIAELLEHAARL